MLLSPVDLILIYNCEKVHVQLVIQVVHMIEQR